MRKQELERMTLEQLERQYPFVLSFFESRGIPSEQNALKSLVQIFDEVAKHQEDGVHDSQVMFTELAEYVEQMLLFLGESKMDISSITILPGHDKDGHPETFERLHMERGEVVAIVGPTGSGKSRLLADIEWAANRDTPTGRIVMLDGAIRQEDHRFSLRNKLVAQLSQNMNFVMDVDVEEFIRLHAQSRMIKEDAALIERIVAAANHLSGEPFMQGSPITSLSGGQSRALMIADTAILSASPIVLIDEIENAGIDRKRALELLVGEEKIVLMATHDPSLALMADRRILIRNGGIVRVQQTRKEEKSILKELEKIDHLVSKLRTQLRQGESLSM